MEDRDLAAERNKNAVANRELERVRAAGEGWEKAAKAERKRRVFVENECEGLRQTVKILESFVEKGQARQDRLVAEITKLASRPPVVIDQADAIAAITKGLAEVLNGGVATAPDLSAVNGPADEYGKVAAEGDSRPTMHFYPDVEIDDWMTGTAGAAGPLPVPGEWSASSPYPAGDGQTPVHTVDPMGNVQRADGQPMFQPGGSAPPPKGGVE